MRSRSVVVGGCALLTLLLVAAPAPAQDSVKSMRIGPDADKKFHFTTDTSGIFAIRVTTTKNAADVDIVVIYRDEDIEDDPDTEEDEQIVTVATSESGVFGMEELVVGLVGAREFTICLSLASGPKTFAHMNVIELVGTDTTQGPAFPVRVRAAGEIPRSGRAGSSEDAALQRLLAKQRARKRGR